jgi:metal-responsive CopG/Arc/MetJ family transcriptional regulator
VCMIYSKRMGRKPLGKERINITLPKGMPKELMDAASLLGKDRSDLIADIAREYLARRAKSHGIKKGGR